MIWLILMSSILLVTKFLLKPSFNDLMYHQRLLLVPQRYSNIWSGHNVQHHGSYKSYLAFVFLSQGWLSLCWGRQTRKFPICWLQEISCVCEDFAMLARWYDLIWMLSGRLIVKSSCTTGVMFEIYISTTKQVYTCLAGCCKDLQQLWMKSHD